MAQLQNKLVDIPCSSQIQCQRPCLQSFQMSWLFSPGRTAVRASWVASCFVWWTQSQCLCVSLEVYTVMPYWQPLGGQAGLASHAAGLLHAARVQRQPCRAASPNWLVVPLLA